MPSFPQWISSNHASGAWAGPNNVPPARAPKSRPPQGLRDKLPFHGTLPRHSGLYSMSCQTCLINKTADIDLRLATLKSKSLQPLLGHSPTSHAMADTFSSSKPSSCPSTTLLLWDQRVGMIPEGRTIGQEKSGFHFRGQKCQRDMQRLHSFYSGS